MKVEKIRCKGFTVISNDVLNNTALSWKAKGLFAYLWSQSDLWDFYEVEVLKHSTDGRASLRAGLKELEEHGYLKRYRNRDDKGILSESKNRIFLNSLCSIFQSWINLHWIILHWIIEH